MFFDFNALQAANNVIMSPRRGSSLFRAKGSFALSPARSLLLFPLRGHHRTTTVRIFLGYLFSVHDGMESISCRNRSRGILSDWKHVRRNFRPTVSQVFAATRHRILPKRPQNFSITLIVKVSREEKRD